MPAAFAAFILASQSVSSASIYSSLIGGNIASADKLLARAGSLRHPMTPNDPRDVVSMLCMFADDDFRYFKVLRGIRWCRDNGADMNALDGLPLRLAVTDKHQMVVEMLLDYGADPNLAPKGVPSPLLLCALNGRAASAETLLKRGADPNYAAHYEVKKHSMDTKGTPASWTPLSAAAANGHTDIVRNLLQHRTKVNWKNPLNGRTALHEAAAGNHAEIIGLLLKAKADKRIRDKSGHTPLKTARRAGAVQSVLALTQRS